jgi:hypothetical protein
MTDRGGATAKDRCAMTKMDEATKKILDEKRAALEQYKRDMQDLLPRVAQARRDYFRDRNEAALNAMQSLEERAQELHATLGPVLSELQAAIGLSDEDVEALEREDLRVGDAEPRLRRDDLAVEKIASTGSLEASLESSLDRLLASIGPRQLKLIEGMPPPRLTDLAAGAPLSLVRGIRPESEHPRIHRFAQSIVLAQDLRNEHPLYDHFAGAMAVTQLARLSERLPLLNEMPGARKRIRSLWKGASSEVDSTVFELLVGAALAEAGRLPEFVDPVKAGGKSPDLLCRDPYPLVVECKRKRPLSDYEISEERVMRGIFRQVEAAARGAGMWGTFVLVLNVEAELVPAADIIAALMQQRYAAGRVVIYAWGKVTYVESSARVRLPRRTRMYSPNLLQAVFDWNSDIADFDGIICHVANAQEPVVDSVERPVGLIWSNLSERALQKRSWGPMSTINDALEQIPSGDFGIVYVAYQEGARAQMADQRLSDLSGWLKDMSHRDDIRVPVCKVVRLYPRTLNDGGADLIESTVDFVAESSDLVLPTILPSAVFTHRAERPG